MNEINFKEIWQNQKIDFNTEEIIQKAKTENKKFQNKIILQSVILFATAIYIIFIIYYFQPKMLTTKIGVILTILAIIIQLIANKNLFSKTNNFENSNTEFLNNLIVLKKNQDIMQTKSLTIYYILLTFGILIYMIEYALQMKLLWAILIYGFTILWFAICWFYFRPIQIKKQNKKLNLVIENLQNLKNQILE